MTKKDDKIKVLMLRRMEIQKDIFHKKKTLIEQKNKINILRLKKQKLEDFKKKLFLQK